MKKHNPDDRRDNVQKIQHNINATIHNMELADEAIAHTSDPNTKKDLEGKNEKRRHALEGMRREIQDEATHQTKRT